MPSLGALGGVDQRMDYPKMEDAAKAYATVAGQLNSLQTQLTALASQMEGGALLGDAGSDFKDAITGVLINKIKTIENKMWELNTDLSGAVAKTRDGVTTAAGRFA